MNWKSFFAFFVARHSCGAPEPNSLAAADISAANAVRVCIWPRDGSQRLPAAGVQESAVARHHGDQHGVQRRLVRGHAIDWRVSIHA